MIGYIVHLHFILMVKELTAQLCICAETKRHEYVNSPEAILAEAVRVENERAKAAAAGAKKYKENYCSIKHMFNHVLVNVCRLIHLLTVRLLSCKRSERRLHEHHSANAAADRVRKQPNGTQK